MTSLYRALLKGGIQTGTRGAGKKHNALGRKGGPVPSFGLFESTDQEVRSKESTCPAERVKTACEREGEHGPPRKRPEFVKP